MTADELKWKRLQKKFPYPEEKPNVASQSHGFFEEDDAESLVRALRHVSRIKPVDLYLELGSWLGKSTRFVLDQAPSARAICGDTWDVASHPENFPWLPVLYETFLVNTWDYRERVVPVRTLTQVAIEEVVKAGLAPDVIYVDAGHDYDNVLGDTLLAAWEFPQAVLVLDDHDERFPGILRFVQEFPGLAQRPYRREDVGGSVIFYPPEQPHPARDRRNHR